MQPSSPTYASACHSRPFTPQILASRYMIALCLPHCTPLKSALPPASPSLSVECPHASSLSSSPLHPSPACCLLSSLPLFLGVMAEMPLSYLAFCACSLQCFPLLSTVRQSVFWGVRVNGFVSEQSSALSAVSVAGGIGRNEMGLKGTALGEGFGLGNFCTAQLCKAKQQY